MKNSLFLNSGKVALALLMLNMIGCDTLDKIETKAKRANHYERVSLNLAKQNRELLSQISNLRYEVGALKAKNNFLRIQLEKEKSGIEGRIPASVKKIDPIQNDMVKFDTYNWTPDQMMAMAEKEFQAKNYEKSAQFFEVFSRNFPGHKNIDDKFLYNAGVASFETQKHYGWTLKHLEQLVENYPTSPFYRKAKLWMALSHLKMGDEQAFFKISEEFRMKYRNTTEWKDILSGHYEKIVQKFKNN